MTNAPSAPLVVQKYGGTSVATPERVCAIADRVSRAVPETAGLVVVLSAMGKSTDELVALAHQVARRPQGREMDLLLATGEQVSVSLLGLALQDKGVPTVSLTATQCGIRTDGRVQHRPHPVDRHNAHPSGTRGGADGHHHRVSRRYA